MGVNAPGRQIEEYYSKTVFTKRYPGPEEAVEGLESATERLCGLLASRSDDELRRPFAPGKWSPAEVSDHLVIANEQFADWIRKAADPAAPVLSMPKGRLSDEGKAIAPFGEVPRAGRDREELIADIRRTTAALREAARHAGERGQLDELCLVHAFFGEMTARECLQLAAWHMVRHVRKLA